MGRGGPSVPERLPVPPTVESLEGHCPSLSLQLPGSRASSCLLQTKAELSGEASGHVKVKELCFHKKPGRETMSEGAQVAQRRHTPQTEVHPDLSDLNPLQLSEPHLSYLVLGWWVQQTLEGTCQTVRRQRECCPLGFPFSDVEAGHVM